MTNLLNSLLDISRLDAGAVTPEFEEFPVQRRSLLTRVEILSVARSFFYARSALALAACSRNRRKALVGKAVRAAQRVGRHG